MTLAAFLASPAVQAVLVLLACSTISYLSSRTSTAYPNLSRTLRAIAVALSTPVQRPRLDVAPTAEAAPWKLDTLEGVLVAHAAGKIATDDAAAIAAKLLAAKPAETADPVTRPERAESSR